MVEALGEIESGRSFSHGPVCCQVRSRLHRFMAAGSARQILLRAFADQDRVSCYPPR